MGSSQKPWYRIRLCRGEIEVYPLPYPITDIKLKEPKKHISILTDNENNENTSDKIPGIPGYDRPPL